MKKIAILGAVLALSTSAIADDSAFYAKIGATGSIGHKLFDDAKVFNGTTFDKDNNKFGKFSFGGSIGAGYKLMDNVRVELTGSYFAGPEWKYETAPVEGKAGVDEVKDGAGKVTTAKQEEVKGQAKSTNEIKVSGPVGLLNAYIDVFNFGPGSVYVNGGAGMSFVTVKSETKADLVAEAKDTAGKVTTKGIDAVNSTVEYDAKARFAWNVGAGVSFSVSEGVSIDVGYSFSDLGKPAKEETKGAKSDDKSTKATTTQVEFTGNNIRSHNVNVGVRFSL